jgi:hypothetical protein
MSKGIESQILIIVGTLIAMVFILLWFTGLLQMALNVMIEGIKIILLVLWNQIVSLLNPFS